MGMLILERQQLYIEEFPVYYWKMLPEEINRNLYYFRPLIMMIFIWSTKGEGIYMENRIHIIIHYINGLMQNRSNSSALAMELLQSCAKLLIYSLIGKTPHTLSS